MSKKDHTQHPTNSAGCCSGKPDAETDLSQAIQWPEDIDWEANDTDEAGNDHPVLNCKLSSKERARRRAKVVEPMREAVVGVEELDDGYALEFNSEPGVLRMVLAFVEVERLCCPFFRFEIRVTPDGGPIWLEWGGSPEIKRALTEQPEFVELLQQR